MLRFYRQKKTPRTTGSGVGLKGGDHHYRAYVGPPHFYDLMAAMVFNLLTSCGLRQHHKVIDIGCGSLRMGRLLIPYLDPDCYFGAEPERWLVEDGLLNELGRDIEKIKRPQFIFGTTLTGRREPIQGDFAIAQSIFTHTSMKQIDAWLTDLSFHLTNNGALFATFFKSETDYLGDEWIYPDCARYRPSTLSGLAEKSGFRFRMIDWAHPRNQSWCVFHKPDFDDSVITDPISWNRYIRSLPPA